MSAKTLSKSRFKLAVECPTKVYYSLDRRYVNARDEDEFLQALADGGFQVGDLAKQMFRAEDPAAAEIMARSLEEQERETAALLARENVTIFEATVRHGDCLVRVDVLRKLCSRESGRSPDAITACGRPVIELIEVKSKSFRSGADSFRGAKGGILGEWRSYLQDVAFQTWVCRQAYPEFEVRPLLLLVDPTRECTIDGLGTAIRVARNADNRPVVTVEPGFDVTELRPPLMTRHDVGGLVDEILGGVFETPAGTFGFAEFAERMAAEIVAGRRVDPPVGAQCKKCEFYCEPGERSNEVRSGWAECIESRFAGMGNVPRSSTVYALYNHRKAGDLIAQGKLLLRDLDEDDVGHDESVSEISPQHRHRLQVAEACDGGAVRLLRERTLREAFAAWRFPLHFIDFETSRPTLPFTAARRPNQQLLFQFSHHVMDAQGRVEHRSECLVAEPGVVPNAAVVRALRAALSGDAGTVLHWWDHERTVLKDVREQLRADASIADREALAAFIGSLVDAPADGPARLVDMGRPLVAKTAFIAGTDGRSSIKKVLQALLSQSAWLRGRYSRPVYGTSDLPSRNFRDWAWWREEHGHVVDPYLLLGQLLPDAELDRVAREEEEDEASLFVANGGAAMVAYGELQRRDLQAGERRRLEQQLLRYCELDTLAMVMVYEALREWVC